MSVTMKDGVRVGRSAAKHAATQENVSGFGQHAARGAWAGAAVLLLGSIIDLGVLWILQFQASPQWEFVATMNTLEAYTRFSIAVALIYAALYMGRSISLWKYRAAAAFMLLLGLAAIVLGLVLVNDYFALGRIAQGQEEATGAMVVTVAKGLLLSGMFAVVFIPLGIMGLRRPRTG
jgi:hypothetical protein